MKVLYQGALKVGLYLAFLFIIQGYSSSNSTRNQDRWREFYQSYDDMKLVVKHAIKGESLGITGVDEQKNKSQISIVFRKLNFQGNSYQQAEGQLILKKLNNGKTAIKIKNPSYHHTVPDYRKEDYQRVLFNRIDKLLE